MQPLRILSLNTWQMPTMLELVGACTAIVARRALLSIRLRELQAGKQPFHVIALQEMWTTAAQKEIAAAIPHMFSVCSPSGGLQLLLATKPLASGFIPFACRGKPLHSGLDFFGGKGLLFSCILVEGERVIVATAHAQAQYNTNDATDPMSGIRAAQLLEYPAMFAKARKVSGCAADCPIVLAGDLNTNAWASPALHVNAITTLLGARDAVKDGGLGSSPTCNAPDSPYRTPTMPAKGERIDFILPAPADRWRCSKATVECNARTEGVAISDHEGISATLVLSGKGSGPDAAPPTAALGAAGSAGLLTALDRCIAQCDKERTLCLCAFAAFCAGGVVSSVLMLAGAIPVASVFLFGALKSEGAALREARVGLRRMMREAKVAP